MMEVKTTKEKDQKICLHEKYKFIYILKKMKKLIKQDKSISHMW